MLWGLNNINSLLKLSSGKGRSKSKEVCTDKDDVITPTRIRANTFDAVNDYKIVSPGAATIPGSDSATTATGCADGESSNSMSTGSTIDSSLGRRGRSASVHEANAVTLPPQMRQSRTPEPRERKASLRKSLEDRAAEEKQYIKKHDSSESTVWYLIDVDWLQAWKAFAIRGEKPPGPICNARLVDRQSGKPKPNLRAVDDYRGVNDTIWKFWLERYGGGPEVKRNSLELYTPEFVEEPQRQKSNGLRKTPPLPVTTRSVATPMSVGSTPSTSSSRWKSSKAAAAPDAKVHAGRSSGRSGASGVEFSSTSSSVDDSADAAPTAKTSSDKRGRGVLASGGTSASSSGPLRRTSKSETEDARRSLSSSAGATSKAVCCDKCDGAHETDKCPHFRKAREKHQDAWTLYGKKKCQAVDGDGAPIVRSARVVVQPGDGSCLFHSLSYGLGDRSTASSLRRDICSYIAKNPSMTIADTPIQDWIRWDSQDSVAQYAKRMGGGTWGGGIEMAALTKMKGVNVHVYEKCREGYRRISAFEVPRASKTVSVLYQGRQHYDAIVV